MDITLRQSFSTVSQSLLNRLPRKDIPIVHCHCVVRHVKERLDYIYAGLCFVSIAQCLHFPFDIQILEANLSNSHFDTENGLLVRWPWRLDASGDSQNFEIVGRHDGPIMCILFHPHHKLLVTGSADRSIRIWDILDLFGFKKDRCLQTIVAHDNTILAMAYHYDVIITGSVDKRINVWKPEPGRDQLGIYPWFTKLKTITGFNGWVTCIWATDVHMAGTAPDVVVGDLEGDLTLLRSECLLQEGKDNGDVTDLNVITKKRKFRQKGITDIMYLASNDLIITSAYDNKVLFSDSGGDLIVDTINNARNVRYTRILWCKKHEEVFLVDDAGTIEVYKYHGSQIICRLTKQLDSCRSLSYHNDQQCLIVAGMPRMMVYNIERLVAAKEMEGHTSSVVGIHLDYFNVFMMMPIMLEEAKDAHSSNQPMTLMDQVKCDDKRMEEIELLGYNMITTGRDGKVCVWIVNKFGQRLHDTFHSSSGEISCSHFIPELQLLISGHENGNLCFWDGYGRSVIYTVKKPHRNTLSCLTFGKFRRSASDSRHPFMYVISGGYDGRLCIYDISDYMSKNRRSPQVEISMQAHELEIVSIVYNPLAEQIISAGNDGTIRIWSPRLECLKVILAHRECVSSLALDGYFLFTGGEDTMINVWNTLDMEKLKTLKLHDRDIQYMNVVPDTGSVISSSRDGVLVIWDYTTEEVQFKYEKRGREFTAIAYDYRRWSVIIGEMSGKIVHISLETAKNKMMEDEKKAQKTKSGRNSAEPGLSFGVIANIANKLKAHSRIATKNIMLRRSQKETPIERTTKTIDMKTAKGLSDREVYADIVSDVLGEPVHASRHPTAPPSALGFNDSRGSSGPTTPQAAMGRRGSIFPNMRRNSSIARGSFSEQGRLSPNILKGVT